MAMERHIVRIFSLLPDDHNRTTALGLPQEDRETLAYFIMYGTVMAKKKVNVTKILWQRIANWRQRLMSLWPRVEHPSLDDHGRVEHPSLEYNGILNLVATSSIDGVGFPGELVVEILCKLPVKSLIRFKTVCKAWKLLIESHVFINECVPYMKNQQRGYSVYPKGDRPQEGDNVLPVDTSFIVGACNGIICLATYDHAKRLLLFNPFTREFSFVPGGYSRWGIFGFYYLPKTQQYQIITFSNQPRGDKKLVDITILTLGKTTSSREVKGVSVPGWIRQPRQATSGTTMVWLGVDYEQVFDEIVICYDVIEERFTKMNVPPSDSTSYLQLSRSLGVLKDSVIMFVSPRVKATFFDIWMLVDDVSKGKSWMNYRRVGPLDTGTIMNPVDVCWDDRWVLCGKADVSNDKYSSNDLFYFDLETDQVKDYKVTDPPIREFVNYVESLVSINNLVPSIDTSY